MSESGPSYMHLRWPWPVPLPIANSSGIELVILPVEDYRAALRQREESASYIRELEQKCLGWQQACGVAQARVVELERILYGDQGMGGTEGL